ncbi:MAG: N-6 DNA methylase [Thermaerobacter sp.]|nr:N-6 DNA methylase [Thermaerobacter sp.]
MLDTGTKRRIDTARDILVGKVPDPKSQVEQITIALIYKFMDDMDAESEELGGRRTFFAGEFARYGWAKLMRSGLGGHEVLNLYAEAIVKMPQNPGIPPLFRDIFKNAYLPYRDPETLRAFLKVIDEFEYDHSERLGDAFEYLLSVLGSQGDAGQFRTPRHIIDFMVKVVDPKKSETVLDPACGTAGFLISSYKHIRQANADAKGHSTLSPDERGRLAKNFKGYDISPDMVRLSLVNLYLHGFNDPHIYEYDTLTSMDRWNEYADVILANPPFMSPKGGIRPHNRFSVQSNRSEVLFVDYMAEHLTPTGRAGIIVPEGIIFQSQNAYKQLRKLLVEESLVAVVSLPAGVFQPYSGVKTSVLILDKALAKKADTIAFFKIESDGFGLGAQRRANDKNDLPQVQAELGEYLRSLRSGAALDEFAPSFGHVVEKTKVAENGEYSLSGDRYKEGVQASSHYPYVELGDVVEILDFLRRPITKHDRKPGPYPYYGATGVLDHVEGFLFDEPLVLVGEDGAKWGAGESTAFAVDGKVWVNNHAHVIRPRRDMLLDRYLIEVLNTVDLTPYITGVTVPKLNQQKLRSIRIPVPPLDIQREIVAEIEGYQKVIDGARMVVENYKPYIPIDPEWQVLPIGEVCSTASGGTPLSSNPSYYEGGIIPWLRSGEVAQGAVRFSELYITEEGLRNSSAKIFAPNTVLVAMYGATAGEVGILQIEASTNQAICGITTGEMLLPEYLYLILKNSKAGLVRFAGGGAQPNISQKIIRDFHIPIPPLAIQQTIVEEIKSEQAIVEASMELAIRFEKKVQDALSRIWGATIL